MVAKGLIDPAAPRRRHRRTKAEIEAEAALLPPGSNAKRRRGRPRKADVAAEEAPEGAAAGEEAEVGTAAKPRRRRKKVESAPTPALDPTLVGQPVSGVLDGCFDAGYLLTVRVGDSEVVLRGVLFGPGLTLPVTKNNDIAPDVRFLRKDETVALPPQPVAPAPAAAVAAAPSLVPTQPPPETLGAGSGAAGERVVEPVTAAAAVKPKAAAPASVEAGVPKPEDVTVKAEVAAPTPLPDVTMAAATLSPQQDTGKQGFGVTPSGFSTSGPAAFSSDSARPVNVQMGA